MMKKFIIPLFIFAIALVGFEATAQIKTPAASPAASFEQTVGLTTVSAEYSRPGVKGRTIFAADGLVPHGQLWRTGANAVTKLSFSDDVMLGGVEVKAGSYAVLTKPSAKMWEFMLYPYEKGSWSSYKDKEPAVKFAEKTQAMPMSMENFAIMIDNLSGNGADLFFMWDKTMVAVPLKVHADKQVMANIDRVMNGPSTGDYYAAGSYYHTSGKDLNKALEYVQKATKVDEPKFWQVRRESLILADMKRYKEAIVAAKLSKQLAEKAGNKDYIKMNTDSIKEWTGMAGGKDMKSSKSK